MVKRINSRGGKKERQFYGRVKTAPNGDFRGIIKKSSVRNMTVYTWAAILVIGCFNTQSAKGSKVLAVLAPNKMTSLD